MISRIKSRLALQISLIILALVLACAVSVGISSYVFYRNDSIDSNAGRALAIAQTAAAALDGDEFGEIMATGEKTAFWYSAKTTLDSIKRRTDVKYMYVLGSEYTDEMVYFAEGYDPATDDEAEVDLWETEPVEINGVATYADEMYTTLATGTPTISPLYDSGDFGQMVSGFAPVTDTAGRVVGVVGVDISLEEVMQATSAFAWRIVLIIALYCIAAGVFSVLFISRRVGRPIGRLTQAAKQLSMGGMDIDVHLARQDEIGTLADAFGEMAGHTRQQAAAMAKLAEGDLTVRLDARSDKDLMNTAIQKTIDTLNERFRDVQSSSHQVALGADQIASGAQMLASGSTQQAATLQQFSAAINDVLGQSQENTRAAADTYDSTLEAGSLMERSMASMEKLAAAMQEINESSEKIAGVIKVVDDIAFQTNILALNAAVEAARAGQHGKGFAVVADEVRSLAAKSAEAARETGEMIGENISRVEEGAGIAAETRETLQAVNTISAGNAEAMERIKTASTQQNAAISEITVGIGELSNVVQANSATAEESAASAEEMSSQAQMLNTVVGHFKLEDQPLRLPR